ncbi:MAG: hypothetical protein OEY49_08050 [Candidatus Heimdallarchaeota archaeon]|nr:hypothetical protein [Candidatus Heimdallarchaeota archaeon]
MIHEGYLYSIPSKTTVHRIWIQINPPNRNTWIKRIGYENHKLLIEDFDVDSSGFEIRSRSVWRYIKWQRSYFSKNSKMFHKVHLARSIPSVLTSNKYLIK